MKIRTLAAAAAVLFATTIAQAETFYNQTVGNWTVIGDNDSNRGYPACWMEYSWQDGSLLQIGEDLRTGELDIWFQNNEWEIIDPVDQFYTLRVNIVGRNGTTVGGNMDYQLINKNTILIPNIEQPSFWRAFGDLAEMRFIMPGTIQNAWVSLANSRTAMRLLAQCQTQSRPILNLESTPGPETKNDSI